MKIEKQDYLIKDLIDKLAAPKFFENEQKEIDPKDYKPITQKYAPFGRVRAELERKDREEFQKIQEARKAAVQPTAVNSTKTTVEELESELEIVVP